MTQPIAAQFIQKVLLVDDTDFDREKVIRALNADPLGQYEFRELSDGMFLDKVVSEWRPDLIVLDLALPGFSGLKLLKQLKAQNESAFAVVMLTGTGDELIAVEAMKLGAIDYVTKENLTPGHIREVIRRALKLMALQQEVMQHRREISESEERLRQLANAMPQIVWIANASGHIEYVNERWTELTGITLEQLRSQAWIDSVHPDDRTLAQDTWIKMTQEQKSFTAEYRYRQASNGIYLWHLISFNPVRDAVPGQINQWYGTSTNIHQSKTLQNELNAAIEDRDNFLAIASHELRTPLTSLKLTSQLVTQQLETGLVEVHSLEGVKKRNSRTAREVDKLIRLVDDMLDVTRIGAKKLYFETGPVDYYELACEVFDKMAPMMAEAKTPLILDCAGGIHGSGDRFRLEQVFINLLTNSMRYGNQNPVHLFVRSEDGHAVIEVKDQGIGLESGIDDRIFQRFERIGNGNGIKGLGVGLFITKQIIEAHQGTIRVVSGGLGKGSTFIVTIPLGSQ